MRYLSVIAILLISSCKPGPIWQHWMYEGPQGDHSKYPKLYVDGWKDGCHTGVDVNSTRWYRMFYEWRQDPIKAQNKIYYKGWKDAFDYCQRMIWQYNNRPFI